MTYAAQRAAIVSLLKSTIKNLDQKLINYVPFVITDMLDSSPISLIDASALEWLRG